MSAIVEELVPGRRQRLKHQLPTRKAGNRSEQAYEPDRWFYTVTSIAPVLLIVIAIAGFALGQDAAQNALTGQFKSLMGQQTAEILQTAIASASGTSSGVVATIIGIITLIVTASGVFGEMQTALNAIWKAKPQGITLSGLIRARATSLGLVAALGFLLMVSLVVSTGLTAFGNYLDAILAFGKNILMALNVIVSIALISFLFAAIYKVLPDRILEWRDVVVGAIVTAVLFSIGKSLISWHIGSSAVASSFGAAGGLIVLLLWVYYSAQIFLLGAEFTKVYANTQKSMPTRMEARKEIGLGRGKRNLARARQMRETGLANVSIEDEDGHKIDGDELLDCITGKKRITEDLRAIYDSPQ